MELVYILLLNWCVHEGRRVQGFLFQYLSDVTPIFCFVLICFILEAFLRSLVIFDSLVWNFSGLFVACHIVGLLDFRLILFKIYVFLSVFEELLISVSLDFFLQGCSDSSGKYLPFS